MEMEWSGIVRRDKYRYKKCNARERKLVCMWRKDNKFMFMYFDFDKIKAEEGAKRLPLSHLLLEQLLRQDKSMGLMKVIPGHFC